MNTLDQKFNIGKQTAEVITPTGEVLLPENTAVSSNIDYDYDKTRNNLHSLIAQGQDALYHALEVAKQSEHPRAFEVVGNLVKQLADVNHQLLDLSDKRQKIADKSAKDSSAPQVTNNNAFFVGSTAELNKMIRGMTEGK